MKKSVIWKLFVDGASRKNPGPSGAGIYIEKAPDLRVRKFILLSEMYNV